MYLYVFGCSDVRKRGVCNNLFTIDPLLNKGSCFFLELLLIALIIRNTGVGDLL